MGLAGTPPKKESGLWLRATVCKFEKGGSKPDPEIGVEGKKGCGKAHKIPRAQASVPFFLFAFLSHPRALQTKPAAMVCVCVSVCVSVRVPVCVCVSVTEWCEVMGKRRLCVSKPCLPSASSFLSVLLVLLSLFSFFFHFAFVLMFLPCLLCLALGFACNGVFDA